MRAREADPLSAFGGIVGLNREIDADDGDRADLDVHRGGDRPVVHGGGEGDPGEEDEPARRHRRLRRDGEPADADGTASMAMGTEMRSFLGGMLHQEPDRVMEAREPWPPSQP